MYAQRRGNTLLCFWYIFIGLVAVWALPTEKIPKSQNNKELIIQPELDQLYTDYQQACGFISDNGLVQIEDFQITNLVLTSDIEGNLNAVNRKTGELLWSLVGGQPLVYVQSDDYASSLSTFTTPISYASQQSSTVENQYPRHENSGFVFSNTKGRRNNSYNNSHSNSNSRNNIYNDNNNNNRVRNSKNAITWIVEPFGDGTVYHFTGNDGLEKLPISIKQLVLNSPYSIDDQFMYTGKRISGLVKINAKTGAIVETFGLDKIGVCSMNEQESHYINSLDGLYQEADGYLDFDHNDYYYKDDNYNNGDEPHYYESHENDFGPFITLGKTIYELTIHSKNNTSWNITYVKWGPNNLHTSLLGQNIESIDEIYIQPFHDSSLLALDADSKSVKWVSNLPYVTVSIFDVFSTIDNEDDYMILPHPTDHRTNNNERKHESTYIDKTKEGSWYALSEINYPSLVRSAPLAKYITNERWRLPSIFANNDLLEISIAGVHDNSLKNKLNQERKLNNIHNNHLAVYQSATATNLPAKYNNAIDHSNRLLNVNTDKKLSEVGNSDGYDLRSPTMTFKKSSFSNLLYRALENVFVALLCLGIFYILSKLGSFKLFGEKLGPVKLITVEHDAPPTQLPSLNLEAEPQYDKESIENHTEIIKENDKENIPVSINNADTLEDSKNTNKLEIIENENDDLEDTVKRKRKRGSRGGKKNKKKDLLDMRSPEVILSSSAAIDDNDETEINSRSSSTTSNDPEPVINKISNNLSITDDILGFGSHGTIVFKGYFENRPVAVKRMLLDFYDVASHEINLLQESDDHSNVVRYFCSQENNKFLYIALELCSASLEDVIEKKIDLGIEIEKSQILYQIANGVNHLHSLKIVHRDIKPQNILVATSKKIFKDTDNKNNKRIETTVRFLISDFGLCKKLDNDQSSFRGTTANAAGTSGWRAPELLLDTSPAYAEENSKNRVRLTRSLDTFSTGCVFFYILTSGYHPFGDRYIREGNIIKNEYDLSKLNLLPDSFTVKDLIGSMIQKNPILRPDMSEVLKHPYFWSTEKKLEFLLKVSDRFEVERRDPPSELLLKLESIADEILGKQGWFVKFNDNFIDNLGKYRKYNPHKLMDLLRAIRNKYHHYQDLPKDLAVEMGPLPDGFYWYFARRFPRMLLVVYRIMDNILHDDELLSQFF